MTKLMYKALLIAGLLCSFMMVSAQQDPSAQAGTGATAPDNTRINKRDRASSEPTADQQKENASDRQLTRQVRRAIVKDKSLSTYAHNVKVISQQGTVTLKGPVRSDEEKKAIESKAAEIAGGPEKIHSEIEVSGNASGKPSPNPNDKQ